MKSTAFIGGTVLAMATLFGGQAQAGDEEAAAATPSEREVRDSVCPMKVKGTKVTATDVEGGVALVFTSKTGDAQDIRRRVKHIAQIHGANAGAMMTTSTVSAISSAHPQVHRKPMPPSTASAEDVERGARLVVLPKVPAQLMELRRQVRTLAKSLRQLRGECGEMAEPVEVIPEIEAMPLAETTFSLDGDQCLPDESIDLSRRRAQSCDDGEQEGDEQMVVYRTCTVTAADRPGMR